MFWKKESTRDKDEIRLCGPRGACDRTSRAEAVLERIRLGQLARRDWRSM